MISPLFLSSESMIHGTHGIRYRQHVGRAQVGVVWVLYRDYKTGKPGRWFFRKTKHVYYKTQFSVSFCWFIDWFLMKSIGLVLSRRISISCFLYVLKEKTPNGTSMHDSMCFDALCWYNQPSKSLVPLFVKFC
jgi:hypothetical protein